MTSGSRRITGAAAAVVVGCTLAWVRPVHGRASAQEQAAETEAPPPAFTRVCSRCHDGTRIVESRRLREQWDVTLDKMVALGAAGSEQDFDEIVHYLLTVFGRVNVNTGPADDMALVLHLTPKDSEAIVRFRGEHGKFADFEALTKVPDLPVERLRKLRDAMVF
jgi:competence protein ComEA